MIQLLFETHEMAVDSEAYRVATAILLHGKQELAGSLREQFVARFLEMDELSANDVAQLGSGRLYFAYGSNLSSRQMRRRCPTARVVIPAFLSNWKFEFNVAAPHLAGAAGGIRRSPNDHVVGILHQLSRADKARLDEEEDGGYKPQGIAVKPFKGRDNQPAFTYVPDEYGPVAKPDPKYLSDMLEGASEHHLDELVSQLRPLTDTDE